MKILIISDAWHPQINGVVRTLEATRHQLERMGHGVQIIGPDGGRCLSFSAPSYPSIKLEFFAGSRLHRIMASFNPDCIHIATEGPLGWSARNLCLHMSKSFTSSYHTRFPEYLAARCFPFLRKAVRGATYAVLRRFHAPSSAVMVATASIERELQKQKFRHIVRWSRGVDTTLFRIKPTENARLLPYHDLARPILLYIGRVAVEKNLEAFLNVEIEGTKVIIGDGPDLTLLKSKYPSARFLGTMGGEDLAEHYSAADLFVFPSTTDTFGLVLLEAAASGLRIASYPAPGPADIFEAPIQQEYVIPEPVTCAETTTPKLSTMLPAHVTGIRNPIWFFLHKKQNRIPHKFSFAAQGRDETKIFRNDAAVGFAILNTNLENAINCALALPRDPSLPRQFAETFSWEACTQQFLNHLQAPTPQAVKRITRLRSWMSRWWQRALALLFK